MAGADRGRRGRPQGTRDGAALKKAVSAQHDEVLGIFFPERAAGLPVDLRRLRSSPAV